MDPQSIELFKWLNSVGTAGLAFVLWLIVSRRYVHIEELRREIERGDRLEERLDKALDYGERALGAGETIHEKLRKR